MSAPTIILLAPVSGVMTPLAEVPDPAFAERMAGDGVAIVPENDVLLAPCRGLVSHVHEAGHALTMTTPEGLSVLLHIGLDTVLLKGRGFTPLVAPGDAVEAGQPLIAFDAGHLAAHAKSTLTLMLVTNSDLIFSMRPASGLVQAGHSPALVLTLAAAAAPEPAGPPQCESPPLPFLQAAGLHARPAAVLAAEARRFAGTVTLACADRSANAKSVAALMALGVRENDAVIVSASGERADEAVAALVALLETEAGPRPQDPATAAFPAPDGTGGTDGKGSAGRENAPGGKDGTAEGKGPAAPDLLRGVPASPGLAAGFVRQWRPETPEPAVTGGGREAEEAALKSAMDEARSELEELAARTCQAGQAAQKDQAGQADRSDESAAIFMAQRALLDDPELLDEAFEWLDKGHSAAFAWREACDAQAAMLAALPDPLIAARAEDVRDVGRRVIRRLTVLSGAVLSGSGLSGTEEPWRDLPERTILIAEELPPSVVAALDPAKVPGFCTVKGSAASHASLLARTAGIVSITALEKRALIIADGTPVLLDGTAGHLRLNPDARALDHVRKAREKAEAEAKLMQREALRPAVTLDGTAVRVDANISGLADVEAALAKGADGVGLFRTEFLFLEQGEAPPEEKQAAAYARIAKRLGPDRQLVLRTLDAGGDKPLPFLRLPEEGNPFLGLRGYRISREYPDLFAAQIRAALKAAPYCRLCLMLPLITSAEELREARAILEREKKALGVTASVPLGIMVEVPSIALLADSLADEADFFSIGTNDLAQYTLAADRGNPKLAASALHPAVLRLIAMTVRGARLFGKPVGICGDIAADPEAAPLLLGLGADSLSMPPAAVPAVKAAVRGLNLTRCRTLAADALTMLTPGDVRNYLKKFR